MNMKDMIQRMTDIETNKTQLTESQQLAECPPDMAEGPMQQGAPVSMNVSLNASGMDHVADLISLMKNAGLDAKPAGDVIMPMRHDIEKFRAAMDDDPEIPGRDDVEGDQDLQQGIVGSALGGIGGALAGGALGAATGATGALGSAVGNLGSKAGGALAKAMGKGALGQMAGRAAGSTVGSAVGKAIPSTVGGAVGSEIGDRITGKEKEESVDEWDNEPNPEYRDHKYMTKDLSGGINREKKAYKAAQRGDNAMAVEAIKAQLMAALEEKKAKPDYIDIDGDGDKEEPMKKAVKDKKAKKTNEAGLNFPREDVAQAYKIYADALKKDMLGAEAEDLVAYFAVKKLAYEPEDAEMLAQRAAVMHIDKVGEMQDEGIISTVKKAYQDAKKEKEKNDYYNKLAGDALKRMEPKELKPYYDAMRDKKKKK